MAAVDYFLKLDGIEGESVDKSHKGWIEISSFSWGLSQESAGGHGGGGGTGKVSVQDFHFVANTGIQSPPLLVATGTGQHFKKAVLSVREAALKSEHIKIELADVLVSSYQIGGNEGSEPIDQFSLNFAKIEMAVRAQTVDGGQGAVVTGGWDVAANKKI